MGYAVSLISDVTSNSGANDRLQAGSGDAIRRAHRNEDQLRDLMVRYQQGDAGAVDTLVANLSPALLRFCSGPGMSPSDAEDLVQDCWLRNPSRSSHLPAVGAPAAVDLRGRPIYAPGRLSPQTQAGITGSAGRRNS